MKVKPGLPWRPQDVGDARVVGYLQRKIADIEWNHSKRKNCVSVNKAERSWRPEDWFGIRRGDAEFGVCPAGFWSYFGPVFPQYATFPLFWNSNVYLVLLYVENICSAFPFDFTGDYG